MTLSIHSIAQPLTIEGQFTNSFAFFGWAFFCLSYLLVFYILVHDICLLNPAWRPDIATFSMLHDQEPFLYWVLAYLGFLSSIASLQKSNRILFTILVVPWFIYFCIVLFIIVCPLAFIVSIFKVRSMSRIMVLITGGWCTLWAVFFIIVSTYDDQKSYAVVRADNSCVCKCEFGLSSSTYVSFVKLGAFTAIQGVRMCMRVLKGLRRQQWANLISILYAVPVEVFPVDWRTPEDKPIQHRDEDMPVQSEPAFDPFALMDEQPNSFETRLICKPSPLARHPNEYKRTTILGHETDIGESVTHKLSHHDSRSHWHGKLHGTEHDIGCCGMPKHKHYLLEPTYELVSEETPRS